MKKKTLAAALFFTAMLFSSRLNAGGDVGTYGGNFLKIPVSVIPAGLSDAYTALSGPDSALFNPAGIGLMSYNSVSVSHNQYFEGIKQEYISAVIGSDYGNFGLIYDTLSSGDIRSYDLNENIIGNVSTSHKFYCLSYSKSWPYFPQDRGKTDPMLITPSWTKIEPVKEYRPKVYRFSLGASVKRISERLDDMSSSANAFDAGALLVLPNHWQIGAALQNFGGRQKFYSQTDKIAAVYRFGLAKDFHTVKDLMVFTFSGDMVSYQDDPNNIVNFGMETDILKMFQLRFGFKNRKDVGGKVSGGFGMNFDKLASQESFFKGMRMDYALVDYGDLGVTHRLGVQMVW